MTRPRLGVSLDARRLIGRLRGRAGGERVLRRMSPATARQLGLALRHAMDEGMGGSVAIHGAMCRRRDHLCRCAVLVLVPGARA